MRNKVTEMNGKGIYIFLIILLLGVIIANNIVAVLFLSHFFPITFRQLISSSIWAMIFGAMPIFILFWSILAGVLTFYFLMILFDENR